MVTAKQEMGSTLDGWLLLHAPWDLATVYSHFMSPRHTNTQREKGFSDKSGDSKFAEIIQEHQTRATSPMLGITKAWQHKDGQLHIFKGQNPENRTFF